MRIIRRILAWLTRFFASKAGKQTAKVMAGIGIGGAVVGGSEIVVAHRRNRIAEAIKTQALKTHDEAYAKVDEVMTDFGKKKIAVYDSFFDLADMIETIQQRPDFNLTVAGVELPRFQPEEYKQLSMAIEAILGGAGVAVAGGAVGVAAMGTGTLLALAPGVLMGGVVLCAMGTKMLSRSAEAYKQAKQIQRDVKDICEYYKELKKVAERYNDSFQKILVCYSKYMKKMQKILERKSDWDKFSKTERRAVENTVLLAQLLCQMCSVDLVLAAKDENTLESVNGPAVDRMIADAKNVREQVEKRKAA